MTTFTLYDRAGSGFSMSPNSAEGISLYGPSDFIIEDILSDDGSTIIFSVSGPGDVEYFGANYFLFGDYLFVEDLGYFDSDAEPILLIDNINWEVSVSALEAGAYASADFTTLPDIFNGNRFADTIYSGLGNDVLYGNAGNDNLHGETGNDRLYGGAGIDKLYGDTGNDILVGAAAADLLVGGAGNDLLVGGAGKDTLTGSTGADKFDFNAISESVIGTSRDIIKDLNIGDKIDLSTIDANINAAGNQAFRLIAGSTFTSPGQLMYNTATHVLSGNIDSDSAAEFQIQVDLASGNLLDASDFIL